MKYFLSTAFLFVSLTITTAQPPSPIFSRGVNLIGWFQANSAKEINFRLYTKRDFENIQSLGCDVIRLPINLKGMTNGHPNYTLEPLFLEFLDSAVSWVTSLKIHLIFDNHSFSVTENTVPSDVDYLKKVWRQMAQHYKNSSGLIYYEVLNEPHGISDEAWNSMQQEVIDEIRSIDQEHTIIIGPAGWNSYNNLAAMPQYNDPKLIYTFHFYDPFLFTHQGASWVDPSMVPLGNMPFPYNKDKMPELDASFNGTWIQSAYNNYHNEGTVEHVKSLIDKAVEFRDQRNVALFCGEFGVYQPNSDEKERVAWYELVREYLEENDIAWTMWDYHGGFGIFEEGGTGYFDHNLNVPLLEALGLNIPPQTPYEKQPEKTGFMIYDDYFGRDIQNASYTEGSLNYYSKLQPNNGSYVIEWTGAALYNSVGFDFSPEKDLSELAGSDYALDMFVRGDDLPDNFNFDVRFIDTKTSTEDRPWRNRFTITPELVDFNGEWHHLHIPLQDFTEHGAWDEGWHNPEGKFNWANIDRVEFSTETSPLKEGTLWFDNILITDQDTARVWNTAPPEQLVTGAEEFTIKPDFTVFPNPANSFVHVRVNKNITTNLLQVYDAMGNNLFSLEPMENGNYFIDCSELVPGLYLLKAHGVSGKFVRER